MPKLDISKELKFDHYEISCNMSESNAPFPYKLFALLLYESGSIIRWIPHGRAFLINDVDEFVMKVMPKYFKRRFFKYTVLIRYIYYVFFLLL